ncbi:GNAT family N-acetyltransferase [Haematobacter massiliensis]|uniref:Transcriptional regulator n=1 Tax=Haematobacter massiliensis TaxID=195105 RepID=A0A086Y5P6_9RHOB|nr:GNAT family N-acetyltransferase [Haematobacter massiliensis]KFI29596.1 transcriptional regulator [Haematobacter massiliensis]OWJ73019.1 GNAT family N-acetyltransferase [Haematobacter massiliensis]OWJ88312.1 GNAT family N-acetyltransferase [Haematobacter massiliensis]QBJ25668.1 GNAT family N-acetyltransferase [Haematobacter massiliensis]
MTSAVILRSSPHAPEAQPLIEDLIREYDIRYGTTFDPAGARAEVYRYPPEAFAPPTGDFLLIRREDETIGGGAFMRHDAETAELKRIWTRPDLRKQGLARQIVLALEESAAALGYTRLYLTTGFRQPEAEALYVSLGYRRLFDPAVDRALYRTLPFEKHIGAKAGQPGTTPLKEPAATPEEATERTRLAKAAHAAKIAAEHAFREAAE